MSSPVVGPASTGSEAANPPRKICHGDPFCQALPAPDTCGTKALSHQHDVSSRQWNRLHAYDVPSATSTCHHWSCTTVASAPQVDLVPPEWPPTVHSSRSRSGLCCCETCPLHKCQNQGWLSRNLIFVCEPEGVWYAM